MATYSGDSTYSSSADKAQAFVKTRPTVLTGMFTSGGSMGFGRYLGGTWYYDGDLTNWSGVGLPGTFSFSVDGHAVAGCQAVAVITPGGSAQCSGPGATLGAHHAIKAQYNGGPFYLPADQEKTFDFHTPDTELPVSVAFPSSDAGESVVRVVTLRNSGIDDLVIASVAATGPGFAVTADHCGGTTVGPDATCTVEVTFAPPGWGAFGGTLTFTDNTLDSPHTVALAGATLNVAPGGSTVAVPLTCPAAQGCDADGSVTVDPAALARAAKVTTVARFPKVHIAAGKVKTVKLRLAKSFVRKAQKRKVRRIKATLTINTTLGGGQRTVARKQVTVVLPRLRRTSR